MRCPRGSLESLIASWGLCGAACAPGQFLENPSLSALPGPEALLRQGVKAKAEVHTDCVLTICPNPHAAPRQRAEDPSVHGI